MCGSEVGNSVGAAPTPTGDTLHRTLKAVLDSGEVATLDEAQRLFAGYRLVVEVGLAIAASPTLQAMALTIVNTARRCFLGGVDVVGAVDVDLKVPWRRCGTLAEAGTATVICLDEFGPLNLQPQPGGRAWAPRAKPRRIRATYTRPHGIRHLIGALDVGRDRLYGHVKPKKRRVEFLAFCRYLRSRYPPTVRLHFVLDNFSAHQGEVREWAARNNVELAFTPHYASWLNRIEPQFKALRYFCLAGTDHPDHATQARLIRRYIHWRNRNTDNPRLQRLVNTAHVA